MIDYSFPLEELEYFLLILIRVSCFIFVAPFFGSSEFPRITKAALSVFVAIALYGAIPVHEYPVYDSILQYSIIILKEAITGLLIGIGAQFCTLIVSFAGNIIDTEIGFSMASVMDPTTRQNLTLTSMMYNYTFMLLFIVTGMYRYLIGALHDSFALIPVGGAEFILYDLYNSFLKFMSDFIIIGFRIALPVFCSILLLNGILGIMAKVSPQMNMFSVGLQIKVLAGLGVLFLTAGLLPQAADFIFTQMKVMIVAFVKAMGGTG